MGVALPPGYRSLTALDRDAHAGLRVAPCASRFAGSLECVYVSVAEFFAAARDYPLVFTRGPEGAIWPVAVLGLQAGQNLFLGAGGTWCAGVYVPAYVRRYPFYPAYGVVPAGKRAGRHRPGEDDRGDMRGEIVICVDESGLVPGKPGLFDPLPGGKAPIEAYRSLVSEMEGAARGTERLCRRLVSLDLLEPFEAQVHRQEGAAFRLGAMERVSETRLNALSGDTLAGLANEGALSRIYAHLWSLESFGRLLRRAEGTRT